MRKHAAEFRSYDEECLYDDVPHGFFMPSEEACQKSPLKEIRNVEKLYTTVSYSEDSAENRILDEYLPEKPLSFALQSNNRLADGVDM